ncbi:MAG: hypothetical protein GY809_03170, partial [Planctomycetes bacterium]|nr:hypothetical protein [Planctomycetota bacterium]
TTPGFHKVFANASGTYIEYDTHGDHKYNPTGLIRIHLKDAHPQLGPSDGCASLFSGKGVNYAVGPAWQDAQGHWTKLADLSPVKPVVEVLEESVERSSVKITYTIGTDAKSKVVLTETITVKPNEVIVEDQLEGDDIKQLRVYYPMLLSDGMNKTHIQMHKKSVRLEMEGKDIVFQAMGSSPGTLVRSGQQLKHRNGLVEPVYFDVKGKSAKYRISTGRRDQPNSVK